MLRFVTFMSRPRLSHSPAGTPERQASSSKSSRLRTVLQGAARALIAFVAFASFLAEDSFAGPFASENLVVLRVGDGSAAGGQSILLPGVLQEFTTTGSFVQSIELPTAGAGSNHALTFNRLTDTSALNRSVDGRYLVLGGTDAAPRTTPANPVGRVIGRVDADGNVDTSTRFSDAYGGQVSNPRGIRSVVSVDGSTYWTAGDGSGDIGIRHVAHEGTTSTVIDPVGPSRHLTIFQGQLYNSNGTARSVGTGLPTSGPVEQVQLDGLPFGVANSPVFFDLDPSIAGPDTLYVGGEGGEGNSALRKFVYDGTAWSEAAAYAAGDGLFGLIYLTGRIEDGKVAIYATARTDSSNAAFGNSVVKLVDEGDNGFAFSTLAIAEGNYTFRGIAFAPVPEPSSYVLALMGVVGLWVARRHRRLASA